MCSVERKKGVRNTRGECPHDPNVEHSPDSPDEQESTMKNTTRVAPRVRTKRGKWVTILKLRAGYREERAHLSVGMEKHRVILALEAWEELPLVVRYTVTSIDESVVQEFEERFPESALAMARILFKYAGQPQEWPFTPIVQSV